MDVAALISTLRDGDVDQRVKAVKDIEELVDNADEHDAMCSALADPTNHLVTALVQERNLWSVGAEKVVRRIEKICKRVTHKGASLIVKLKLHAPDEILVFLRQRCLDGICGYSENCVRVLQRFAEAGDDRALDLVLELVHLDGAGAEVMEQGMREHRQGVQEQALRCLIADCPELQSRLRARRDRISGAMSAVLARCVNNSEILQHTCEVVGRFGLAVERDVLDALLSTLSNALASSGDGIMETLSALSDVLDSDAVRMLVSQMIDRKDELEELLQSALLLAVEADADRCDRWRDFSPFDPASAEPFSRSGDEIETMSRILAKLGSLPSRETLEKIIRVIGQPSDPGSYTSSDGSAIPDGCYGGLKVRFLKTVAALSYEGKRFGTYLGDQWALLCSPEAGLVAGVLSCAELDKGNDAVVSACWYALKGLAAEAYNVSELVDASACLLDAAMRHLHMSRGDAMELSRCTDSGNFRYAYTLTTLVNLAQWSEAREALKRAGAVDFAKDFYSQPTGEKDMKANVIMLGTILLAYLVGSDESSADKHLLSGAAEAIPHLIDCLECTADKKEGLGYASDYFSLPLLVGAVKSLCVSLENRVCFATSRVIDILVRVIRGYNEGRDAKESAEGCVSVLLLLSFSAAKDGESDEDFERMRSLLGPSRGVEEALLTLEAAPGLDPVAQRNISWLLMRLNPPDADDDAVLFDADDVVSDKVASPRSPRRPSLQALTHAVAHPTERKHIMVSYCWSAGSKPEQVKKMCEKLKAVGYDVWRDEGGSSVVGKMGGNIVDRMVEAVEKSSHVIICVSKDYKERPNCRAEAEYASTLSRRGQLQILYCMMDEGYTTVSSPSFVDGWLRFLMGSSYWYGLWNDSVLEKTCTKLRDDGLLGEPRPSPSPSRQSAPHTPSQAGGGPSPSGRGLFNTVDVASGSRSFHTPQPRTLSPPHSVGLSSPPWLEVSPHQRWVWQSLTDPRCAVDSGRLESRMRELGIASAEDVPFLSARERQDLTREVRPVRRRALELTQAWVYVSEPEAATDPSLMAAALIELGVTGPSDLAQLDSEDLQRLAGLLKKAKRKAFEDLLTGAGMGGVG